jgi:methyl-accepting chemotaxis protein
MHKQMPLSYKLGAMIMFPIVCLIVYVGLDLQGRVSVSSEMDRLTRLTRLAMATNHVTTALQVERSYTAGVLSESAAAQLELGTLYEDTDEKIKIFSDLVEALDPDEAGERLYGEVTAALEELGQLPGLRTQIANGELQTTSAYGFYISLTRLLLPIVNSVSVTSTDAEVMTMLRGLDLLSQIKESSDLERGSLNVAFTLDMIGGGLLEAVIENIARQEEYEKMFLGQAPPQFVELYNEIVSNEMRERITVLRLDAKEGAGADQLGVDPDQWWRVSSERIDAISEVELELGDQILTRVVSLRNTKRWQAFLGVLVAMLMVGGTLGISYWVGRSVNLSLTDASGTIRDAVVQISSSVQELTASTGETAAAVSQTSTTVDQLRQTSEAASKKAEATSASADLSRGASEKAQQSSVRGIAAMQAIRSEVEGIAERIVELSEKNAQISDIVQNVNAIAEQSNLLAVNASIEAAKAGEHGRGFAVVANEVKTLAERSKEATDQIRAILAEIQRSSNAAVMVTEQGVKRVDEGTGLIEELGEGIQTLAITIEESADSATQISLISSQQLAGIEQITEAVRSVERATSDNAAGAQQLEEAARRLAEVCDRITSIVQGMVTNE